MSGDPDTRLAAYRAAVEDLAATAARAEAAGQATELPGPGEGELVAYLDASHLLYAVDAAVSRMIKARHAATAQAAKRARAARS